jgi:hypothetical protein
MAGAPVASATTPDALAVVRCGSRVALSGRRHTQILPAIHRPEPQRQHAAGQQPINRQKAQRRATRPGLPRSLLQRLRSQTRRQPLSTAIAGFSIGA